MNFYDDVLRELIVALGAALFIGNLYALIRRRADRRQAAKRSVTRSRPGSPVRASVKAAGERDQLAQAPIGRTIGYLVLGFVVMVWGIATIIA